MIEAYFTAIRNGDQPEVAALLDRHPEWANATLPHHPPGHGGTGLHLAVLCGHTELVQTLVELDVPIDALNDAGRTALHDSIEHGHQAITEYFLTRGATVDICAAAILGMLDRVKILLDADPALANDRTTHLSPLGWAAFGNQVETATLLLDRGAHLDDGELLCAASVGHVEVGQLLLTRGADPNALQEPAGANALHAAARMRFTNDTSEFVQMLLRAGADPSIRTRDGQTALEIASALNLRQEEARREEVIDGHERNFAAVITLLRQAYFVDEEET